ncbi:hypothetical protein Mgra_00004028 [Meloidogyne graminicola]|uniref:F-box domain-containing protein n=1 Tax=Meloidogyne graminicola TaxID=189291 RepID=A0A8S9ZU43_9BILA|nr:hypothetical protein Mgra_00004028 [Meloidogyne graminicola]
MDYSKQFNFDDFLNCSTEFNSKCNSLLNEFKQPTTSSNIVETSLKNKLGLQLSQLSQLTKKLHYRIKGPIIDNTFNDPLIEVFKFLTRKQLYNSVQLTNKYFYNVVKSNEDVWPKYKFGSFDIDTDTSLSNYCSFKDCKELRVPPQELSPILASLSTSQWNSKFYSNGNLKKPIKMLTILDMNAIPEDVFFFFNTNEEGCECSNTCESCSFIAYLPKTKFCKFYVHLPNMLGNRLVLATAIFWVRQFSKIYPIHFSINQHRWTKEFVSDFLIQFGLRTFLPIVTDSFGCVNPIPIPFLQKELLAKSLTIWDMKGDVDFYNYLINKKRNKNKNEKNRIYPETLTVYGFIPQNGKFNGDEQEGWDNIFDALIKFCRKTRYPEQLIKKIHLSFDSQPAPWIHTNINGLKLIYRSSTFKIDQDGIESETTEVRYSLVNIFDTKHFEIRLECNSNTLNEQMNEFTLIRETSEE